MRLELDGRSAFVGSGGVGRWSGAPSGDVPSDGAPSHDAPCAVFVHGAGMDRTVWLLHARWFARRGFDVVAPDLPGHGGSAGPPLPDVPAMADWLGALLGALRAGHGLGAGPVALVGHSMGALVALEAASRTVDATELLLLGAGYPMAVGDALLDAASRNERAAIDMITIYGHGHASRLGRNPMPGISVLNASAALLERAAPGVLHADLAACRAWDGAEAAAERLAATGRTRARIVAGDEDRMTPMRGTRTLAALLDAPVTTVRGSGHMLMAERPEEVLREMRAALVPGRVDAPGAPGR